MKYDTIKLFCVIAIPFFLSRPVVGAAPPEMTPCSFSETDFLLTKKLSMVFGFHDEDQVPVRIFFKPPFSPQNGVALIFPGKRGGGAIRAVRANTRIELEPRHPNTGSEFSDVAVESFEIPASEDLLVRLLLGFRREMLRVRYNKYFNWVADPYEFQFLVEMDGPIGCAQIFTSQTEPGKLPPIATLAAHLLTITLAKTDLNSDEAAKAGLISILNSIEMSAND